MTPTPIPHHYEVGTFICSIQSEKLRDMSKVTHQARKQQNLSGVLAFELRGALPPPHPHPPPRGGEGAVRRGKVVVCQMNDWKTGRFQDGSWEEKWHSEGPLRLPSGLPRGEGALLLE